ncbi:hypothetical protein Cgig2_015854 [Carnegiea gigantea]|uniref:Uncharacterized protein n=1 Tax=Carnegiea gigantea TaxID=171969 RepID=A0A9Q1GTM5_9CARY|nr:hypothetical protein Cgig2_015854 [Carnegiea gigantea]
MPLDRSFPDYIDFSIENNVLIRQRVHYEWLPLMCSHYAQFKEIVKYHIEKKGQGSALKEDIKRHHYVTITHSALALMKQQSKVEWIGFGDECSRHFIAKIKQRKSMQCIYQIKDKNDQWVEGFDRVADIMAEFYHNLLGRQEQHISTIYMEIIGLGHTLNLDQQLRSQSKLDKILNCLWRGLSSGSPRMIKHHRLH